MKHRREPYELQKRIKLNRLAKLCSRIHHKSRDAEKQRYEWVCIREAHMTHLLSTAKTPALARRILWMFSTHMTVDAIRVYLELPHVTCPARTCFSKSCPAAECPQDYGYDPERLSVIFKTDKRFVELLLQNPSRAKVMLAASLETTQLVLLELAIKLETRND